MTQQLGDSAFLREDFLGRSVEMTYGGALSFLRRKYTHDIAGADVVVSGIPFDCATTFRPGARLGPQAVRAASVQLAELLSFPFGFDPFDKLAVADYGDCFLDSGYPEQIVEKVEAHADTILENGAMMLTLGGDHFVTYPLLRAHAKKHGPLSLIHFDAHVDTWDDDGERLDHGSMFLRAVREGIVDPTRSVQIGIRTFNDKTFGFTILDAPWVHQQGVEATVAEIKRVVGAHKAYLTFDIDCLDPSFAPGTGTPVAGGLSSAQALSILRSLGDLELIAMDVVEVAPAYDHAEITAIAAATLAHDFLCLMAIKKGAVPRLPEGGVEERF
ncbi:agmatinase [Pelagibius sp. Alg239-R121]|uniref:agmatinase n=1 Tax=Pelagibius sp. Alg239-R121 TaxID=2993448 RepID=UPI0024A69196|nr:agmatinase [Pelagibius sp. Alg239-R121]